jgi:hypothetical protein
MQKSLFILFSFISLSFNMLAQGSTVTRSLPAFDEVYISGGYDAVELKQGDTEMVVLEVSGIDPDNIITEVKNGKLEIRNKRGSYRNFRARMTVTFKNIRSIRNSGSTDIKALSTLKASEFALSSSGSGDFTGAFDVKDLSVSISGSSDMKLSGNADNQKISISGSGDVDAKELKGNSANVSISGSGDVRLGVKGQVSTSVSGSGHVSNE